MVHVGKVTLHPYSRLPHFQRQWQYTPWTLCNVISPSYFIALNHSHWGIPQFTFSLISFNNILWSTCNFFFSKIAFVYLVFIFKLNFVYQFFKNLTSAYKVFWSYPLPSPPVLSKLHVLFLKKKKRQKLIESSWCFRWITGPAHERRGSHPWRKWTLFLPATFNCL